MNHVEQGHSIKLEDVEIKDEELHGYNDEQVDHMNHHYCYSWIKREKENMDDEIYQPPSTFCLTCKLTQNETKRRTIITRLFKKKLDKHEKCEN